MRTPNMSGQRLFALINEQKGRCAYCGTDLRVEAYEREHVIPFSWTGGYGNEINIVLSCGTCNRKKADRILNEQQLTEFIYEMIQSHGTAAVEWPEGAEEYWKYVLLGEVPERPQDWPDSLPSLAHTDGLSVSEDAAEQAKWRWLPGMQRGAGDFAPLWDDYKP